MRILLICAVGMSTSLLVKRMLDIAPAGTVIDYAASAELDNIIGNYDVLLIGPQLRYKKNQIRETAEKAGIPSDLIDSITYGRIMAKEVLQQAMDLFKKEGKQDG